MVGVGVAEGGQGSGGPADGYYGEYYPPEPYYVPQEMCPHPQQHPQHPHMCTVHAEYGGMPVVTMPQLMPQVMDYLVAPHPHPHHPPHHQPPHHQPPPHHQQPHPYTIKAA